MAQSEETISVTENRPDLRAVANAAGEEGWPNRSSDEEPDGTHTEKCGGCGQSDGVEGLVSASPVRTSPTWVVATWATGWSWRESRVSPGPRASTRSILAPR
jgi:hypothetical protein